MWNHDNLGFYGDFSWQGVRKWRHLLWKTYPSIVCSCRHYGVGLNSMCARIAGILAPLVRLLDMFHQSIPMVIYGLIPLAAGGLCWLLPETLNVQLQDHAQKTWVQFLNLTRKQTVSFRNDKRLSFVLHFRNTLDGSVVNETEPSDETKFWFFVVSLSPFCWQRCENYPKCRE